MSSEDRHSLTGEEMGGHKSPSNSQTNGASLFWGGRLLWVLGNAAYPAVVGPQWQALQTLRVFLKLGLDVSLIPIAIEGNVFDELSFRRDFPTVKLVRVLRTHRGFGGLFRRLLKYAIGLSQDGDFDFVVGSAKERIASGSRVYIEGIALLPLLARLPAGAVWFSSYDSYTLRLWRLACSAANPPLYRFKRLIGAVGLGLAETWALRHARRTHYVSAVDVAFMARFSGREVPRVIPTILDPAPLTTERSCGLSRPYYLISGQMKEPYLAVGAAWFAREVWPFSALRLAGGELVIHGGKGVDHTPLVGAVAGLEGVRLLTWVEDVDRLYGQAEVVVLTDRGGTGLKNRLLMAARHARPVLGSSFALEGFDLVDGLHVSAAESLDDVGEWQQRLNYLFDKSHHAFVMGENLREFILARHSPETVLDSWARYLELPLSDDVYGQ